MANYDITTILFFVSLAAWPLAFFSILIRAIVKRLGFNTLYLTRVVLFFAALFVISLLSIGVIGALHDKNAREEIYHIDIKNIEKIALSGYGKFKLVEDKESIAEVLNMFKRIKRYSGHVSRTLYYIKVEFVMENGSKKIYWLGKNSFVKKGLLVFGVNKSDSVTRGEFFGRIRNSELEPLIMNLLAVN